jgi:hypothetical protein
LLNFIERNAARARNQLAGEKLIGLHVQDMQPAIPVQSLLQLRSRQHTNIVHVEHLFVECVYDGTLRR